MIMELDFYYLNDHYYDDGSHRRCALIAGSSSGVRSNENRTDSLFSQAKAKAFFGFRMFSASIAKAE